MTSGRKVLRWFGALLMVVVATALVACGGDDESGGEAKSGGSAASTPKVDTSALGPQAAEMQKLYDAARKGGEDKVVVYAGLYTYLKPMWDAFSKRFPGITIEGKDTFGAPMETTIGQEVASRPAQRGDIALTADTTMLHLADNGLLQSYKPPAAVGVEGGQFVYKDNLLTAANYGFYGNLVNTDVVKKVPKSWEDLLDPALKGKVALMDPTKAGPGNGALTTLAVDPRYGLDYAEKLKANDLRSEATPPEVINKVVNGTYGVGVFTGYTTYLDLKKKGAPVDFVYPVQKGVWVPIEYFGFIQNAPHPNAAKLLMNWYYSPEAAKMLPQLGEASPIAGSPTPKGIPPVDQIPQLEPTTLDERLKAQERDTERLQSLFGA